MANEIQVTVDLQYTNGATVPTISRGIAAKLFSIVGTRYIMDLFSVPTTAGGTAIPLGTLGTLGMAYVRNTDPTNYVELLSAVSGTVFAKLKPGEAALFRFPSAITAPAALANTAAVKIEYLFLED